MNKKKKHSPFILLELLVVLVALLLVIGASVGSYFFLKRGQEKAETTKESPSSQIEREQEQNEEEPRSEEEISTSQSFFLYVSNPEDGIKLTANQLIVTGRTLPYAEVFVNDKEAKADAKGNFSLRVTLEEGENPLIISAGDESGEAEVERTVYYEK